MTKLADIKTGDILAWKRDRRSKTSDFLIRWIKILTRAEYGHVGVAIRVDGFVFVYEASLPMVKLSLCRPEEEVFHLPMNLNPSKEILEQAFDKLGLDYGIMDCVRALFGIVSAKDDKWQCAELTANFYESLGIHVSGEYTPNDVIMAMKKHSGGELTLVE